jgi:hypothetical protein
MAALISMNKLKKGIFSNWLSASAKTQMYKAYIRPTLYYGLELLNMTAKQLKNLQTGESNTIKDMFHISRKKRSTILLKAIDLNSATAHLSSLREKLFVRIMQNQYTRSICETIGIEKSK